MNIGFGSNKSKNKSQQTSSSSSQPLNADQLQSYWNQLNANAGGRLNTFAQAGTPGVDYQGPGDRALVTAAPVSYEGVTADQVRALGGLGATRTNRADQAYRRAIEEALADPSLTTFQRSRTRQNLTRDLSAEQDAIAQEVEAAITGLASQEAGRRLETATGNETRSMQAATSNQAYLADEARKAYDAALAKAGITAKDLELLASIFFGGKGQTSTSYGQGTSSGGSSGWNFNFGIGGG